MVKGNRLNNFFCLKKKRTYYLVVSVCAIILNFLCLHLNAQAGKFYTPKVSRVLIVLDASGSMKEKFQDQSKFETATLLLEHVIDSIQLKNPNIQFALRVFGHQYPKSQNNCKDTKLEVPFAKENGNLIHSTIGKINPQGQTAIAYTLFQALTDFPDDSLSTNSIILITDGIETCDGDLCAVTEQFNKKRIAMKPFIIGMGLADSLKTFFDCVGTFMNTNNDVQFSNAVNAVVSQALNTTSVQINLLNAYGAPSETNVEMTLYDHFSHKIRYNLVHTLNAAGNPDTLYLDPIGHYDLVIHSYPEVEKQDIVLTPGRHNVIAMDVPQGILQLQVTGSGTNYVPVQCIIRLTGNNEILNLQDLNTSQKYLTGKYDLEILTLPRIEMYGVSIDQSKTNLIKIPLSGTLSVNATQTGVCSVLYNHNGVIEKVYDFYSMAANSTETLLLQPGDYTIVFRPDKGKQSILTQKMNVTISSNKTSQIKF